MGVQACLLAACSDFPVGRTAYAAVRCQITRLGTGKKEVAKGCQGLPRVAKGWLGLPMCRGGTDGVLPSDPPANKHCGGLSRKAW
jgi:hypothetical protein